MSGPSGKNTKPGRMLRQHPRRFEEQDAEADRAGLTWTEWVRVALANECERARAGRRRK